MKVRFSNAGPLLLTRPDPYPSRVLLPDLGREPYEVMAAGQRALDAIGAKYWVTYGSLLGLIREGGFIAHDNDIDIAVIADVDPQAVRDSMAAQGLKEFQFSTSPRGVVHQKFSAPQGTVLDLFYVFDDGNERVDEFGIVGHSVANGRHLRTGISYRRFEGFEGEVPVPADSESYLAVLYGPDWRTPVVFWDWVFTPPNVELHLRPVDLPWLVARWLLYRYRQMRFALTSMFAKSSS